MCEVSGSVFLLDQERIGRILYMLCPDSHFPFQFGCIRAQIYDRAALVHIDTGSHIRIAVPEDLFVRTIKDISPQCALRLSISLLLTVIIRELGHCHVIEFSFFFELSVVCHTVLIGFFQQLVRSFPAPHLIEPARSYEHHIVGIAVVIFLKRSVLVDQVIQIRVLPCLCVIDHPAQYILRMCTEVGAVSIIAGQQIAREMRDRHNAAVLRLIGCRRVCILLRRNPRIPRASVKQCIP